MRSVDFSYARLGLNRIDILYVHDIGVYTHGREVNDRYVKQLRDGGYRALQELKSSGAIKAFGLGVNEVPACLEMMADIDIDVILMAGRYSLLDRSAVEELLPLCEKRGTSITAGGVFNSGILATGAVPGSHFDYTPATEEILGKVRAMEAVAAQAAKPLAEFALQFPLNHPAVASVIIGTARPESLNRNMALTQNELPASAFAPFEPHTLVAPPLGDAPVRE
jgi:D-threo-aldose 1-dehydrogenase